MDYINLIYYQKNHIAQCYFNSKLQIKFNIIKSI